MVGCVLAGAATTERPALFFVHSRTVNVAGAICWLLFLLFVTLSELRSVLKQRQVTTKRSAWRFQSTCFSRLPGAFSI